MSNLATLNPEQREAVMHINGPAQCIAAAGSGKTRVITERIDYLMRQSIAPHNILAITFTAKAAAEMKERLVKINPLGKRVNIATFHSIGYSVLKQELFHGRPVALLKEAEIIELIRRICIENNYPFDPLSLRSFIANRKNQLELPKQNTNDPAELVYWQYEQRKAETGRIDFDDMILSFWRLLKENKQIHNKYLDIFRYVMVDEFQDTNFAQNELLKLLATHGNIFIVGDARQAIYSFRDARVEYMLDFEEDWLGSKIIYLNTNYRCAKQVIKVANSFIENGSISYPGTCIAFKPDQGEVTCVTYPTEYKEAEEIGLKIKEYIRQGYQHQDIAILYRVNAQSNTLEDSLSSLDIPYKNHSRSSFFELPEIEVLLGYLHSIGSAVDDVLFRLLINSPFRYISKVDIELIEKCSVEHGVSLYEACSYAIKQSSKELKGVQEFLKLINRLQEMDGQPPAKILHYIVDKTDFEEWLCKKETKASQEGRKMENVSAFLSMANNFDSVRGLLERIEKIKMYAKMSEKKEDKVHLMTLHSSKGLEFRIVFMIGVFDGRLPHEKAMVHPTELEQERRLCYVGMTRAQERLHVSNSQSYNDKAIASADFFNEIKEALQTRRM